MSALFEEVTRILAEEGLEFASRRVGNIEALNLGRMSEETPYGLILYVRADVETVNVVAAAECVVPDNKLSKALVVLNQYNYKRIHKAFIAPECGRFMAQKSLDVYDGTLNKRVLLAALASCIKALHYPFSLSYRFVFPIFIRLLHLWQVQIARTEQICAAVPHLQLQHSQVPEMSSMITREGVPAHIRLPVSSGVTRSTTQSPPAVLPVARNAEGYSL